MRNFLIKTSVFIIPVLALLMIIEFQLSQIPNEYTRKIHCFETNLNEIQILILGSSHSLRAINPHYIHSGKAYNLSMISQPLQIDLQLFRKYRNRLKSIEVLVIPISYFSLSKKLDEGEIMLRLPYYEKYYDLDMSVYVPWKSLDYHSSLYQEGLKKAIQRIIKYRTGRIHIQTDCSGWMGQAKSIDDFQGNAVEAVKRHEDGSLDFSANVLLIREALTWCESNGVKVIFINTPKTNAYNHFLNSTKVQKINETINSLASHYNEVYWDQSSSKSYSLEDFSNADHLNEKGALKYTKSLDSLIHEYIKK